MGLVFFKRPNCKNFYMLFFIILDQFKALIADEEVTLQLGFISDQD